MEGYEFSSDRRGFPRILSGFPVDIEIETRPSHIPASISGEIGNLSSEGASLILNNSFPVSSLVTLRLDLSPEYSSIETKAQVVWSYLLARDNKFNCGVRFLNLEEKHREVLNKLILQGIKSNKSIPDRRKTNRRINRKELKERLSKAGTIEKRLLNLLDETFVENVQALKQYLITIKDKFDSYDATVINREQRIRFLEENKPSVFKKSNRHFDVLWQISKSFSHTLYELHKRYFQEELHSLYLCSPFNRRIYEKPLGYAGDYVMMNYIYEDGYEGDTTYDKLVHRYTLSLPAAVANKNRKYYFKKRIWSTIKKRNNAKITSVACGPAREIIEILTELPSSIKCTFTLVDSEKLALEFIKDKIRTLNNAVKSNDVAINYVHRDILELMRESRMKEVINDQDLIYAAGLIDYMKDRIAAKIIEILYGCLKKGGVLIMGNVHSDNPSRACMEMLGEWVVIHRDEKGMMNLAKNISGATKVYTEREPTTGMNIFLIIEK
jgi:extracellular factor (EF) 3-hydroxypalmitic acid methyl ester biosynthesis protein